MIRVSGIARQKGKGSNLGYLSNHFVRAALLLIEDYCRGNETVKVAPLPVWLVTAMAP
jgi:hypothetical protein